MRKLFAATLATFIALAPICAIAQQPVGAPTSGVVAGSTAVGTPADQVVVTPVNSPSGAATVTVSGGDLVGKILIWVLTILAMPVAAFAARWAMVGAKKIGIDVKDADRARLQ